MCSNASAQRLALVDYQMSEVQQCLCLALILHGEESDQKCWTPQSQVSGVRWMIHRDQKTQISESVVASQMPLTCTFVQDLTGHCRVMAIAWWVNANCVKQENTRALWPLAFGQRLEFHHVNSQGRYGRDAGPALAKGFCRAKFWFKFARWRRGVLGEVLGEVWGKVFGEVFRACSAGTFRANKHQQKLQPQIPTALHSKTGENSGKNIMTRFCRWTLTKASMKSETRLVGRGDHASAVKKKAPSGRMVSTLFVRSVLRMYICRCILVECHCSTLPKLEALSKIKRPPARAWHASSVLVVPVLRVPGCYFAYRRYGIGEAGFPMGPST